jgi:streptogramin lyase
VWIAPDAGVGDLVHIDAKTHEIDKTVHVGVAPVWPAAIVDDMLWVGGAVFHQGAPPDEALYQVDPETATVVGTVPGASGGVAVLDDDLWVNRMCCPFVTRVDGTTGAAELDVRVNGYSNFLTAGGGSVWVRMIDQNGAEQWIEQVNPADGTTVRWDLPVPNRDGGLGFGHDSLWVTDWDANAVHRVPVPAR